MPKGVYERKPMPEATRAKISATMKGRRKSPETRAKMSAAKIGHAPSIGQWKGEDIRYSAAHYRADLALPRECATADETCKGRFELAFRHDAHTAMVRTDDRRGPYYVGDPREGYVRLCLSHHRRYDRS
ncbi:MAG TPA: NUMOD3 domain-containing DNA-binding protein [Verrucomicrobiae bacterium]|nr:NUMOD3 domain-containing DNA-binding protein [Verrucomicrobiae bacterium]